MRWGLLLVALLASLAVILGAGAVGGAVGAALGGVEGATVGAVLLAWLSLIFSPVVGMSAHHVARVAADLAPEERRGGYGRALLAALWIAFVHALSRWRHAARGVWTFSTIVLFVLTALPLALFGAVKLLQRLGVMEWVKAGNDGRVIVLPVLMLGTVVAAFALIEGVRVTIPRWLLRATRWWLDAGRASADATWDAAAEGALGGRAVRVRLRNPFGAKGHGGRLEAGVALGPGAPRFSIGRVEVLDRVGRRIARSLRGEAAEPPQDRTDATNVRYLAQGARQAVEALLDRYDLEAVSVDEDGWLTVAASSRVWFDVLPWSLARLLRDLDALAGTLARREVRVGVFAWAPGDAEARCPFCRDALEPTAPDARACEGCATLHHAECLTEAGGCTVLGCARAARPGTREKVR